MTSAQTDRFVHERLPAPDALPALRYDLLPELQLPEQLNLVQELLDRAADKGVAQRPMLRSPGVVLTYAQAAERVRAIHQVLVQDLGLVPGNRVLLRGGNSIGMALAWLAVVRRPGWWRWRPCPAARQGAGRHHRQGPAGRALCDAALLQELQQAQAAHPVLQDASSPSTAPMHEGARTRWRRAARKQRPFTGLPDRCHRHCAAGVHLRHHRQAQGGGAYAPRRAGRLRMLAAPCAARAARTTS
jgi:hypothetical protein